MKNLLASTLFLLSISIISFGQTAKPTATPPTSESEDVVKISTALIQLDVTVTDKDGKIVTNLKPEDFEIFENDKNQPITNFSFVSSGTRTEVEKISISSSNTTKSPVPPVPLKPEQVRRTIALVVDDFSLNRDSVVQVRKALRKFVDEQMQDGDLVAIVRLSKGNSTFQQFTSDRNFLRAAIEQVNWSYLSGGEASAFEPLSGISMGRRATKANDKKISEEQLKDEQTSIESFSDFQAKVFSSGTLGSLNYVVGGMKDLPGRKSVMLFSDGFKMVLTDNRFVDTETVKEGIRKIAEVANRASVVIYTMDARGVPPTALDFQDSIANVPQSQIATINSERTKALFDTQQGLVDLARQTGGLPIFNSNDLNIGIRKMLDDQAGYYLLAYVPDAETFDPKNIRFNKVTIKLKRPDLKVRYRNGFFGVPDREAPAAKQTPAQQIAAALNSPFAVKGIDVRMNALFANDQQMGTFVNSILHINAKDLRFTDEADGSHKATFDILAVNFNENNIVADQLSKNYTVNLKGEAYQKALRDGLLYSFIFPIKKAGFYQMRVGLRDASSEKVGSANQFIEIPDMKAGHLTISGIILENLTMQEFQNMQQNSSGKTGAGKSESDTSLRRFKQGTVLRYGYEIYNAKLDGGQKSRLTTQTKIFREGKLLFEGKETPVDSAGQVSGKIPGFGAVSLGSSMQPGDYVLQVTITDSSAKGKNKIASQFIQFEITE